jgi:SAM-dependent methyltransferase
MSLVWALGRRASPRFRGPASRALNTIAIVVPREVSTDLAMLERLVDPHGREVVDIGCGAGALARALATTGARVVALEVSQEQLAPALAGDGGSGVRYVVGRAQALPLDDTAVDIAVFMRTLHHVPVQDMTQALREARRVVRPGGTVYVAEPLSEGDFWALTSMIEDEFEARQAAQSALAQAPNIGLKPVSTVEYDVRLRLAGVDQFRELTVAVDPSRAQIFAARSSELAEAFRRMGEPGERPGERSFISPTRVVVLQPL